MSPARFSSIYSIAAFILSDKVVADVAQHVARLFQQPHRPGRVARVVQRDADVVVARLVEIQLAVPDVEAIIDPLAENLDLTPFFTLMANPAVVKVFHAARQDVEIIHHLAGIIPLPIFDTQIAAMVCGFGEAVSYSALAKRLLRKNLDKSSRFTDWAHRPLTEKQLRYALGDVTHLRGIYLKLKNRLETTDRASWLDEEMAELRATSDPFPHPYPNCFWELFCYHDSPFYGGVR